MSKARVLLSQTSDPYLNLATEDWIFNNLSPSEHLLFLWQNSPSVIIGRNQNPYSECNLKKMQADNINLVRRQTGGGAVFQDLGNVNFTFLSSKEEYDKDRNFNIIIKALKQFDIALEKRGRNDLVVGDKKVSGSAFKESLDRAFHHGTLMIDVDLTALQNYLTPSQKKLATKGIESVRSRVANLKEFHPHLSKEKVFDAVMSAFFEEHKAPKKIDLLNYESLDKISSLNDYYQTIRSEEWRLGETPAFEHHLSDHFEWGSLDIHFSTHQGIIKEVKIFSDCLNTHFIELLRQALVNTSYNKKEIFKKIDTLAQEPDYAPFIANVRNLVDKEID